VVPLVAGAHQVLEELLWDQILLRVGLCTTDM